MRLLLDNGVTTPSQVALLMLAYGVAQERGEARRVLFAEWDHAVLQLVEPTC